MDEILAFLHAYRALVILVAAIIVTTVLIISWWDEVRLFWKSVYYSTIGIRKLAGNGKTDAVTGWLNSEIDLCDDFMGEIRKILQDPDMYDRASSYLGKVQERGREELGVFMSVVIMMLVFVEALGFAYILSGYTLPGGSEALQVQGAIGIAFLIATVLVYLTHHAGSELHARGLERKVVVWKQHSGGGIKPGAVVALEKDEIDDAEPTYQQLYNRIDTNAEGRPRFPIWTIIAFVAIASVATGATYVRYKTYEQEKTREATMQSGPAITGSLSLDKLPSVFTAPQAAADKQAEQEMGDARDGANFMTFALLAILFVLIQVMGIGIGVRRGFAGRDSSKARNILGNFRSRSEYEAWYERKRNAIMAIAQKHLSSLQSRFNQNGGQVAIGGDSPAFKSSGGRTFQAHYARRMAEYHEERKQDLERRVGMRTLQASANLARAPGPVSPSPIAPSEPEETPEQMEARLLARIEREAAEKAAAAPRETEEEMLARLRKQRGLT